MAKTLKVLAKELNCSYEAVRKQVKRYRKELEDHIHTEHKTQYLDDYACDFLRSKRQESPVVVSRIEYDEAVELLKEKYTAALEEINRLKDEKHALELENARIALLEAQNDDLSAEKEFYIKTAASAAKDKDKALKELTEAHDSFELELKKKEDRIQELENRKWWQLLFGKKNKE